MIETIRQLILLLKYETQFAKNTAERLGSILEQMLNIFGNFTLFIPQQAVNTFADLATTFPNPQVGWASLVKTVAGYPNGVIYSYNGSAWINTGLVGFPTDVALRGGSGLTIQDLDDIKADISDTLQIVHPNDVIIDDGKYLLFENGDVLIDQGGGSVIIDQSEVNISGFVQYSNGAFGSNADYRRTNIMTLPLNASAVKVMSLLGTNTTPIAFYNDSNVFISAVANTNFNELLNAAIPSGATKYALCRNINNPFYCEFIVAASTINNKDAIILLELFNNTLNNTVLRDFADFQISEMAYQQASLSDMTITGATPVTGGYQITANNLTNQQQVLHPVYTTIERMLFSTTFTVTAANTIIRIGKGYCYAQISGNTMTVYKINDALTGSVLHDTVTLPFSITNGVKYKFTIYKLDAYRLRYSITSTTNDFEKVYDQRSGISLNVVRAWGNAFFGVNNGTVIVHSAIIATGYDKNTSVSFWGNSFLDAGNLLANGGRMEDRYADLVAQRIGYRNCPIMARTGHALDAAFVTRFTVENSYFKSKYVFMGMGTNNTTVSSYTTYMQQCINEAKANNQTPILVTVTPRPDVNYNTVTKVINNWVKASGEKYVDICAAVTDGNGVWIPAYVTADNIHPNVAGNLAMFRKVLIDVPEIFVN